MFSSPFSIVIISLGDEKANLSAFCTFLIGLVCFLLLSGKCCGLFAWPAVVQLLLFIYSGISRISHEYSLLFSIVIDLIFMLCFRFDALTELGAFMGTQFVCISVLKVASGPRASCKSALTLSPPPSTLRWFILLTVLRRWSLC